MAIQVLLIDDDPDFSIMLRTLLRGRDFQVRAVFSGDEGVQACMDFHPDIVLLDLLMPATDGWEVCQRIRNFTNVPIMILSALGAPASVAKALDSGADDYLIKPVRAGLLASRMRALIRHRALVDEPVPV